MGYNRSDHRGRQDKTSEIEIIRTCEEEIQAPLKRFERLAIVIIRKYTSRLRKKSREVIREDMTNLHLLRKITLGRRLWTLDM